MRGFFVFILLGNYNDGINFSGGRV